MGNLCQCPEDMHQDREIKADKYRKYDHKDSFADESDYLVTKSKSQFETNSIFRYKVNKPRNIIYNEFIVCTNNQFSMNGKCGTSMNGEHSHTTSVDFNFDTRGISLNIFNLINRIKENPNHLLLSIDNIIDPKSDKQSERQPYFKEEKENFNEKVQLDHFFTDKENSFSKSKSSVDSTNSKTFEDLKNIKYLIISLLNEKKINHSPIIWSEKTFMQLGEIINELSSKYDINSDKFEELLSEQMELQSHGLFKVTTLNWIGTTDMNVSLFALLITHKLTLENILCSNCSSGCIYANVYNSQIQSKPTTNDFVNSDNTTKVNYSMTLICKNKRVTPSNMEFSSESSNYFQKFKGNTNATTDSEITRLTNFSNFKDKAYLQKMAKLSF